MSWITVLDKRIFKKPKRDLTYFINKKEYENILNEVKSNGKNTTND